MDYPIRNAVRRILLTVFPSYGNSFFPLRSPGAYYARATPVPIPNTEVKTRRAYGTAGTPVGESVSAGTLGRKEIGATYTRANYEIRQK